MGSDGEKPGFEFVRGVECGAPQHGSHAAPPTRRPISSTSPKTVPIRVSCPCPAESVWMVALTAPRTSTLMRQDAVEVVASFFALSSGSKVQLVPRW